MSNISAGLVKELREKTAAGMMDCKKALTEANGNIEKAIIVLREKGLASASKKSGRATSEGVVNSYIHAGGKIGVLLEVNCETDFVAKNDQFQNFVRDLAMHVAAMNPKYLNSEEIPNEAKETELDIYRTQAKESGKPDNIVEKIIIGRYQKYCKEVCMLEQPYVKDPDKSIDEYVKENITKLGENITIRRFVRWQLGEETVVQA